MPRRPRIAVAGVTAHLIHRGNNRSACFFAPDDYEYYLRQLRALADVAGCAIHAYCLMTNHVHLLVTPDSTEGCALLMKGLGQRHGQYVNRTYERTGSLWNGRYRSCVAQSEHYVLACYRYIELNPVRAGMVRHPRDHRWSSYRVNAEGMASNLVTAHEQYRQLGTRDAERVQRYRHLLDARLDPEVVAAIRDATAGNRALGDDAFRQEISTAVGRRVDRGRRGRPKNGV